MSHIGWHGDTRSGLAMNPWNSRLIVANPLRVSPRHPHDICFTGISKREGLYVGAAWSRP